MIYILSGNDTQKKSARLKVIIQGKDVIRLGESEASKEILLEYAASVDLFGNSPTIITSNIINSAISLSPKDLAVLDSSKTLFIFLEDKLKATDEKKYAKFSTIEKFEEKKTIKARNDNPFALADSFARRDKIGTWILYREQIDKGAQPEAISGMLFWKIKTMMLNGTRTFSKEELKRQSSEIVCLYHDAHRGESDFVIGLEQFILSSLTK